MVIRNLLWLFDWLCMIWGLFRFLVSIFFVSKSGCCVVGLMVLYLFLMMLMRVFFRILIMIIFWKLMVFIKIEE